ncbi:MAG: hypothetical protein R6T90_08105 [Dissulfuribacterales bacterium]
MFYQKNAAFDVFSERLFAAYEKYQGKDYTQKYGSGEWEIESEIVSPDYEVSRKLAQKGDLGT